MQRKGRIGLMVLVFGLTAAGLRGEEKVPQRRLDFSCLGVYGTLFDFCDFSVYKLIYFGKHREPQRLEGYRRLLHETAQRGKLNLVGLYCFDRVKHSRPIPEYLANADALLQALDPRDIYAVFLNEENVTWNKGLEVLNRLYDHLKAGYPTLPVYQWLTAPAVPHPKLRADGWVYDLYRASRADFRRKLVKYIVTGKPLVMCLNASPDVAPFDSPPGFASSQGQVEVCREFNVPMFFYCVDPRWGSPSIWLRSDSPDIVPWREWLLGVVNEVHRTDTTALPLYSANFSTGQPLELAGDEANRFAFEEDFGTVQFVDDATIMGLLNLRWDGGREVLFLRPHPKGLDTVELQYHFFSEFELSGIEARLTGKLLREEAEVTLALSINGHAWVHEARATTGGQDFALVSSAEGDPNFKGKEFWVRLRGRVSSREGEAFSLLDAFRVTGQAAPPERREVRLRPDEAGRVYYQDDFSSRKYLHLAHLTNGEQLTWTRGHLGTHGVAGRANKVVLRWKFVAEQPLANLRVHLRNWANERNLGSWNNLAVSLDGEHKLVEETTRGKPANAQGTYRGTLTLDLTADPRFAGIREFWVHVELINNSGVRTGESNGVEDLCIEATAK